MSRGRRSSATGAAMLAAAVLVITGCTGQVEVVDGTEVTVATSQAFYSYNGNTSYGSNPTANGAIIAATNSQFVSYDEVPELVADESFGSVSVVSEDPLTVTYTIADGVTWSDGVPVDAADLLLAWAANSGALNTPDFDDSQYLDPATQQYTDAFPKDVVFFDGSSGGGLQLVTQTPELSDDGQSITLVYDDYFVDWKLVFGVGVPAHVVAMNALDIDDAGKAKTEMIEAIQDVDASALAPISRFWNSGFNFTETPAPDLLVSTGPYTITELAADHATLEANASYRGDHRPAYEKVTVRYISEPLQSVQALADGEVDVIAPQPTEDVAQALVDIDDITVASGFDGGYERLDLQFDNGRSGVFADPRVRQAFLKIVPRQQILDQLVVPLQEEAQLRSSQVFLPGSVGYEDSVESNGSEEYREVDIDGAKALLAAAGIPNPEVCVLFDPANPRRLTEFQLIQASAAVAGFTVTDCSSPDWRDLLGVPGQYDASLYALRTTNLAVTAARASFGSTDGVNNTSFYANPEVDALLDRLDAAEDEDQQVELLTEIDRLVWADAFGVPLYQFPSITAFRSDVTGVAPSPLAPGVLWNVWDWRPAA